MHGADARQALRSGGDEHLNAGEGKQDAESAADKREDERVGKSRADEAVARCAQSGPNREFPLAGDGASQLQVGEVDAADEQDGSHSSQQQPEPGADLAGHFGDEWEDEDGGIGREVVSLVECGLQRGQLRLCLLGGDAGAKTAEDHEVVIALIIALVDGEDERVEQLIGRSRALRDAGEHFADARKSESLGQNADDSLRFAAVAKGLADGLRIAMEIALPGTPGQDDNLVVSFRAFAGTKATAEKRMNAEHVKEVRFDAEAAHQFGVIGADRDAGVAVVNDAETGESLRLVLPVEEVVGVIGQRAGGQVGQVLVQHHQAIGTGESEGLEQDRVDDREDGGDRTDTKGEREDRGEGEAGRFAEGASAEAQVLEEVLHATPQWMSAGYRAHDLPENTPAPGVCSLNVTGGRGAGCAGGVKMAGLWKSSISFLG